MRAGAALRAPLAWHACPSPGCTVGSAPLPAAPRARKLFSGTTAPGLVCFRLLTLNTGVVGNQSLADAKARGAALCLQVGWLYEAADARAPRDWNKPPSFVKGQTVNSSVFMGHADLLQILNSLWEARKHRQDVNEWMQLCTNKTLFIKRGGC